MRWIRFRACQRGPIGVLLVGLVIALAACGDAIENDVSRLAATIVEEDDQFVLIADSTGARYIPNRIPLSYREDGLKVYVNGRTIDSAAPDEPIYIELTSLVARNDEDERTE